MIGCCQRWQPGLDTPKIVENEQSKFNTAAVPACATGFPAWFLHVELSQYLHKGSAAAVLAFTNENKSKIQIRPMSSDLILVKIDRARMFLQEAKSLQQVKQVIAMADAARVYGKQIGATIETQNYAAEIRLRAERRLGEMLKDMPKQQGARGVGKKVEFQNGTPLIKDQGLL